MVGRLGERTLLLEAVRRLASEGASASVAIEAEPGMGKSLLLRSAMADAAGSPLSIIEITGDALKTRFPTTQSGRRWRDSSGGARCARSGTRHAGRHPDHDADRLGAVIGGVGDDGSAISFETRVEVTRRLTARLIATLTDGRPVLVGVDDAQWVDGATWELLSELWRTLPPSSWCSHIAPSSGNGRRDTHHLTLAPLGRADTAALIGDRFDSDAIPDDLVDAVWGRAEGHPLFTEEILRSMRDQGVVTVAGPERDVSFDKSRWEGGVLPESVAASIASRLERLEPHGTAGADGRQRARLCLRAASRGGDPSGWARHR